MKFNLIINADSDWQDSCNEALKLCQSIITNHQLDMVFFFGHAVNIINVSEVLKQWQQWQQSSGVSLCLCSAMVELHTNLKPNQQVEGFKVVGLASWVNAMEQADKVVEIN
ncbi:DsrE family protein [Marinicella sp. S1101]|uniref:DsrE family protein n=1 Tax=Marinicella marina TaxID=2996016 RepID=UPI002260FB82|nr:DsrE family protein [Marinicella marina]MCX7554956.1 DsrE family protein [Marinicella marina]MDJ1141566.1 DsrE family protein [Marinicella marina]